jgi:hypothetical protein
MVGDLVGKDLGRDSDGATLGDFVTTIREVHSARNGRNCQDERGQLGDAARKALITPFGAAATCENAEGACGLLHGGRHISDQEFRSGS